jgi:hypothetical protein
MVYGPQNGQFDPAPHRKIVSVETIVYRTPKFWTFVAEKSDKLKWIG